MRPQEVEKKPEFDLKVTHYDEQTGLVTHRDPYILRVIGIEGGGRTHLWERPAGSGNIFNKKNEPVGRWITDENGKTGKFIENEKHIAFAPPETKDQKLARALTEKEVRIAELEKELAGIKIESAKKVKGA